MNFCILIAVNKGNLFKIIWKIIFIQMVEFRTGALLYGTVRRCMEIAFLNVLKHCSLRVHTNKTLCVCSSLCYTLYIYIYLHAAPHNSAQLRISLKINHLDSPSFYFILEKHIFFEIHKRKVDVFLKKIWCFFKTQTQLFGIYIFNDDLFEISNWRAAFIVCFTNSKYFLNICLHSIFVHTNEF